MGAMPLFALNLVCFPQSLDKALLGDILAGGAEKCAEAGVPIAGGHSIYDKEIKYGLSVTGIADTEKIHLNNTPREGDKLILTKPLGVGIVLAADRAGMDSLKAVDDVIRSMVRLNKYTDLCMSGHDIGACTDITGFGLLGHLVEMTAGKFSAELFTEDIPYFAAARSYADEYLLTAAGQRNRNHVADKVELSNVPFWLQELLFDPQTSGGLLLTIRADEADELVKKIRAGDANAAIIGTVKKRINKEIVFRGTQLM
jgi:selenide,water dikinase